MSRLLLLVWAILLGACASPIRQVPDAESLAATDIEAYRDAAAALDAGEAELALEAIAPVAAHEPWHVPSHVLREDALTSLGRGAEATAWYAAEAARSAADPARLLLAARVTPRADGAREAGYRAALKLDPSSVWGRIALAYELIRFVGDESLRATTLADGGFAGPAAQALERVVAASTEAERLAIGVVADRPGLAAAQGVLADVLLGVKGGRGRRVSDALKAAEEAARLDPGTAAVWVRVARARRESSDDAGAAKALETAVSIAPRDAAAQAGLGRVLLDLRRDADALAALNAAKALAPADMVIALNLGVALFRTADLAAAAAEFARAAALVPSDPRPYEGLALCKARLGDRKGAAAAMESYLSSGGDDRDAAKRFIDEMRGL